MLDFRTVWICHIIIEDYMHTLRVLYLFDLYTVLEGKWKQTRKQTTPSHLFLLLCLNQKECQIAPLLLNTCVIKILSPCLYSLTCLCLPTPTPLLHMLGVNQPFIIPSSWPPPLTPSLTHPFHQKRKCGCLQNSFVVPFPTRKMCCSIKTKTK